MKDELIAAGVDVPMLVRVTNEDATAALYRMICAGWRLVPVYDRNTVYNFVDAQGNLSKHRLAMKSNGCWHFDLSTNI